MECQDGVKAWAESIEVEEEDESSNGSYYDEYVTNYRSAKNLIGYVFIGNK